MFIKHIFCKRNQIIYFPSLIYTKHIRFVNKIFSDGINFTRYISKYTKFANTLSSSVFLYSFFYIKTVFVNKMFWRIKIFIEIHFWNSILVTCHNNITKYTQFSYRIFSDDVHLSSVMYPKYIYFSYKIFSYEMHFHLYLFLKYTQLRTCSTRKNPLKGKASLKALNAPLFWLFHCYNTEWWHSYFGFNYYNIQRWRHPPAIIR